MSIFDRIAEEKIRAAIAAGEFDRLAGQGRPLRLDQNPHEPEGWGTAFRLLKNNGFTLPWLEENVEIERDRRAAHRDLYLVGAEDAEAGRRFEDQIAGLNRRIIGYNLRVPATAFQRTLLDPQTERALALAGDLLNDQPKA